MKKERAMALQTCGEYCGRIVTGGRSNGEETGAAEKIKNKIVFLEVAGDRIYNNFL